MDRCVVLKCKKHFVRLTALLKMRTNDSNSGNEHWSAFISYRKTCHRDNWLAHYLQAKLEGYRTPKQLVRKGVKPRIGRVFIDDEELASGASLSDSLRQAVSSSDHLIVICSPAAIPRSAGIDYMQEEIAYFKAKTNPKGKVFPVLSEGEHSLVTEIGLCDQHDSPVVLDMRSWRWFWPMRDPSEMLQIIAPFIGCSYATLRDRETRRLRRTTMIVTILSLIFAATALFAGLNWREAAEQRKLANDRLSDVLGLARHVFTAADQDLRQIHGSSSIRNRLTELSGEIVARLLTEDEAENDRTILRVRSLGHTATGDQAWASGDVKEALREYRAALEIDERLLEMDSEGRTRYADLAVSHGKLARIAAMQQDINTLGEHARKAQYYAEKAVSREPNDPQRILGIATAYRDLAAYALLSGDMRKVRKYMEARMQYARRAALLSPDDPRFLAVPVNTLINVANLELQQGNSEKARLTAAEAVERNEALLRRFPTNPQLVRGLLMSKLVLGTALAKTGDRLQAIRTLDEARIVAEKHLEMQPEDSESRTLLGFAEYVVFQANMELEREDEAMRALFRAVELTKGSSDPRAKVIQESFDKAKSATGVDQNE